MSTGPHQRSTDGVSVGTPLRRWTWPTALLLLGLFLSYGGARFDLRDEREREREAVRAALEPVRGSLSRELFAAFELTAGLSSLIAVEGGVSQERFHAFAADLVRRNDLIRLVSIAPDNVVTMVHPLEGSERVVGLDFAKNADQWPSVDRMMKEQAVVVAGPVSLVQGGIGVIARSPIYVLDPNGVDQPGRRYWGLASTVVDFDRLLARTPLGNPRQGLSLALRGADGTGARGDPFWGRRLLFEDSPVLVDVPLPAGSWQLAAAPRGGWSQGHFWGSAYFWGGAGLFAILAGLLFKVLQARQARDVEIVQRLQSERKLRAIFEQAPLGIAVVDSSTGGALECNSRYEAMARIDEVDATLDVIECLRKREQVQVERRYAHEDGSHSWVSLTCVPLAHVPGVEAQHLAMAADITQRKQAEEQLVASERMAALGMLAAGVAHEINNPLAATMANIELAMAEAAAMTPSSAHDLPRQLSEAYECAARVRAVVRDLKVFARADEDKLGPVNLARVLDSTLRMVSNEMRHRARLIRSDTDDLPAVHANESRLGQVFANLFVNAVQSIPEGATLDNEVRVSTRVATDGEVVVEVADTGTGMAPGTLKRLFTPFFTTKPAGMGTGLGLAICRRIVSDLGGRIEVASELGVGSTFTVYLRPSDQIAESPQAPVAPVAPVAPSSTRGRVLVVDDEKVLADVFRRILSREHDVAAVNSGREAIDLIAAGERYDVILCDLMMPDVSGMELHAAAADISPQLADRFIFMTGGAFAPVAQEFLERVSNPRLEKPFDRDVLRRLVNEGVGRAAKGRAPRT